MPTSMPEVVGAEILLFPPSSKNDILEVLCNDAVLLYLSVIGGDGATDVKVLREVSTSE